MPKLVALVFSATLAIAQSHATSHVIWVMTDGLRTEEVFSGADISLMSKENHVSESSHTKKDFWRETQTARRSALLPFFWNVIVQKGQSFGNRALGSDVMATNGFNISYPGYNESLTGESDDRINSNDKVNNPNTTLLEWLNQKPAFHGRVAAFAAWDAFPYILNAERADFTVNAGYDAFKGLPGNSQIQLLNALKAESPRDWAEEPFDHLTFHTALEYLKQKKPRVLFMSLGETDDWAHDGKYGEYLSAAHRVDDYLKTLWETIQQMPEYRGSTTLVFSTDHGRGQGEEWRMHGRGTPDSKYTWLAFMGPDTPALGERSNVVPVLQTQVAATIAALLGENYQRSRPRAGAPVAGVVGVRK